MDFVRNIQHSDFQFNFLALQIAARFRDQQQLARDGTMDATGDERVQKGMRTIL